MEGGHRWKYDPSLLSQALPKRKGKGIGRNEFRGQEAGGHCSLRVEMFRLLPGSLYRLNFPLWMSL